MSNKTYTVSGPPPLPLLHSQPTYRPGYIQLTLGETHQLCWLCWGLTFKPPLETLWAVPHQPWENPACSQTVRWSSSLEHTGVSLLGFKILLFPSSCNAAACGGEQIASASPPSQGSVPPMRGLGQEEDIHLAWIS